MNDSITVHHTVHYMPQSTKPLTRLVNIALRETEAEAKTPYTTPVTDIDPVTPFTVQVYS